MLFCDTTLIKIVISMIKNLTKCRKAILSSERNKKLVKKDNNDKNVSVRTLVTKHLIIGCQTEINQFLIYL